MLQAKKTFEACEVKKKLSNLQNVIQSQHALLSIEHNVDLELTLSSHLGPVPWSLLTPDRIPTKTDKSKRLHGLQSHIEPTLDWPWSTAHNFDCNGILQRIIVFPVTFKDQTESVFNQALKAGHVGFVTDTYIRCISSRLLTNILAEDNLGVLFNTGVCNRKCSFWMSTTLARIWGKRSTVIHCLTDCDTTNVPKC